MSNVNIIGVSCMSDQSSNGSLNYGNRDNVYPNAFFDYLTKLLPKQLKVLFVWIEYLYVNSGHIFSTLKKFSEYPITDITIDSDGNKSLNAKVKDMLKDIKMKSSLINIGIDYHLYGNSFVSMFKPFTRLLVCKHCGVKHNAAKISYVWKFSKCEFHIKCGGCKKTGAAIVKHEKIKDAKRLCVIRWDAKHMDINANPITEEAEYYYTIPNSIIKRLKGKKPDTFLLNTLPLEFIQTITRKRVFKFSPGAIYHMKAPVPAGINKEWGFPQLVSAMKPFFYTAILRKANESIALEHIVPMRILYPQGTSTNNDPTQYVSLAKWRTEMEEAIKKWRRDPNHIKFSPLPVGVENMGGDGRAMLTNQEVQVAEENIVHSMGVPKEFVYGGLANNSGSVTLRILENQLFTYTAQLKECLQWLTNEATDFMGWSRVDVGMTDFVLVDDVEQKRTALQFGDASGILSKDTTASLLDLDLEDERAKQLQEAIDEARAQIKIKEEVRKIYESLSQKVKNQESGNPLNYDPQAVMQVAQDQATQLIQVPMEQRKSMLSQMAAQDPVLHAVVLEALKQLHKVNKDSGASGVQAMSGAPQGNVTPSPVQAQ